MNKRIIFLISSVVMGFACYFFALPKLPKIPLLYNFFEYIFQSIWVHIHIPPKIFLMLVSLVFAVFFYLILEISWIFIEEKPLTSRGSARWANSADVKELIADKKGVPVGRFCGKILHIDKYHLVTCAGTRSGKGVSAIIPTLLEYPESVVCLDIKGENYAITARKRKEIGKCFVLNPFNVLGIKSNSYNWLDDLDISDKNCGDRALNLASQLIGNKSLNSSNESHFDEQAKRLIQGLILAVCTEKEGRNFCTVADLLHTVPISQLCDYMKSKGESAFNIIYNIGSQFSNNENERELSGVLSTAQRATNIFDNPSIRDTLITSNFDIKKLPDEIMSIYLIMPQDKVTDFQAYIRVFFDLCFSSIISRNNGRGKYNVLFLLDEVAQLGYMKSFSDQIAFIRGMGAQLWFFFQSYAQLKNIYGNDADNILGNSTQIFYGCNDIKTAELISKSLGKKTIREYKKDGNYNDIAKDLLSPDEVMKLDKNYSVILMPGKNPIKTKKIVYYKDKEYKNSFDNNPYIT